MRVRLIPLSGARKVCQHRRSDLKDTLRRMKLHADFGTDNSSNMHRRNVFPGCTTLQAKPRWPTSDSNSFRVHALRPSHDEISTCISASLTAGRCTSSNLESNSRPRKVRTVVGPSSLSSATGRPSSLNVWSKIDSA